MDENKSMTPYRTPGEIISYPPDIDLNAKPLYGLIRKIRKKAHECNYPSFWMRVYYFFTFRRIPDGSLFRCYCGQCHILSSYGKWLTISNASWKDAGGRIEEENNLSMNVKDV